jgi:hypothetical protein
MASSIVAHAVDRVDVWATVPGMSINFNAKQLGEISLKVWSDFG